MRMRGAVSSSQRSNRFGAIASQTPRGGGVFWFCWCCFVVGLWPGHEVHVFFVSVNQVLVRLWARRRSRCLTGKAFSVCEHGGCVCHAIYTAATFRGVLWITALRDGGMGPRVCAE